MRERACRLGGGQAVGKEERGRDAPTSAWTLAASSRAVMKGPASLFSLVLESREGELTWS